MTYLALLDQLRMSYQDPRTKDLPVLNAVQVKTWLETLSRYPLADVKAVVDSALRKWKWFPALSEIERELAGDPEQQAADALLSADKAAFRVGSYQAVCFEDGALGEALRVSWGTWPRFCLSDRESPSYLSNRKLFLSQYAKYRERGYSSKPSTLGGHHGIDKPETVKALRPAPFVALDKADAPPPSRNEAKQILTDVMAKVAQKQLAPKPAASSPHQTPEHK